MNNATLVNFRYKLRSYYKRHFTLCCAIIFSTSLFSQSIGTTNFYRHSIGIGIGFPNQVNYKFFIFEDTALDFNLGQFSLNREGVYTTLKIKQHKKTKHENVYTYIGAGIYYEIDMGDDRVGMNLPLGIEVVNRKYRLNFYAECAPMGYLGYDTTSSFSSIARRNDLRFGLSAVLGLRYIIVR